MQTGKANYRLAARLRGNELLLDADLRKAVEEEHLRAVRRAEGLKCCADRRAFAESVEWERLGDFFLRIGSHPSLHLRRRIRTMLHCAQFHRNPSVGWGRPLFP